MRRFFNLILLSVSLSALPVHAADNPDAPLVHPDSVEILLVPSGLATTTIITDDSIEQYACVYRTGDPRLIEELMASALAACDTPQYPIEQPRHVEIRNKLVFRNGARVLTTVSLSRLYRTMHDLAGTWNREPVHLQGGFEEQVRALVRHERLQQMREGGPSTCGDI